MKIVGYIFAALLLIYLVLCFIGPKEISASRSTIIDAPAMAVFSQVGDLKNWPAWMPWYKKDPKMQFTWGETSSGVGGHYAWKSEDSGNGKMKIVKVEPGKSMQTEIEFDGMGTSYGSWAFDTTNDGKTKVTWGINAQDAVPFLMRGVLTLTNVQKRMDEDFDAGLASLKELVETR